MSSSLSLSTDTLGSLGFNSTLNEMADGKFALVACMGLAGVAAIFLCILIVNSAGARRRPVAFL